MPDLQGSNRRELSLSDNDWADIERVYFQALELPESERAAFLDQECHDQPALAEEVRQLLDATGDQQALTIESELLTENPLPQADRSGEEVGGYQLEERIGLGGMGEVYRATRVEVGFDKPVALKLLRPEHRSEETIRRFRAERHILARLDHPAIVPIMDGGLLDDGQPWYVMPLITGAPITEFCARESLDIRARVRLFLRICDGVQYAHRNLVVHRDLKPSNILVTDEGAPQLLDFGIAKLLERGDTQHTLAETRTGSWLMTPDYAAPEQVLEKHPTTSVDVYALGILLYEILTGTNPQASAGGPRTEQLQRICEVDPPLASRSARPEDVRLIVGDLDRIISMALRKEPERRYASVADLADDLRRWLDELPVRARPDTLRYRTTKFVRRNRTAVFTAGALLVGLISVAAFATYQARVIATERDQVELERDRAQHVVNVLTDLFRTTDPTLNPGGDTLRVAEFVEQSGTQIMEDLESQPLIRAEMMHVFGNVNRNRSQFEEAERFLKSALDTQVELAGWDDARTVRFFHSLAVLNKEMGRPEAEEMLRESLSRHEARYGPQSLQVADVKLDMASGIANPAGALAVAESGLELQKQFAPKDTAALAAALNQVGIQHYRNSNYQQAFEHFEQAYELAVPVLGERNQKILSYLGNMSAAAGQWGIDLDRAVETERRILEIQREVHGPVSHPVATNLNNLATYLVLTYRIEEAIETFLDAYSIYRQIFGQRHPQVANTARNLCVTSIILTADPPHDLVGSSESGWSETGAPESGASTTGWSGTHLARKDAAIAFAQAWADSAVAASRDIVPYGPSESVIYEMLPPWVRIQSERATEAIPMLEAVLSGIPESDSTQTMNRYIIEMCLAMANLEDGRLETAQEFFASAEPLAQGTELPKPSRMEARLGQGVVAFERGELDRARELLEGSETYTDWILSSPCLRARILEAAKGIAMTAGS